MKSLIVLADGTGNSAAKLFKTNVWRLYQALDPHTRAAQSQDVVISAQRRRFNLVLPDLPESRESEPTASAV